jgi:hypothetical protein
MSGLISDEVIERRAREMRIASVAKRVLFIGNSLTFWNQGVDVMLAKLVPGIETSRVAVGGATLETLWNNDEAKLACADNWNVVVLQEDLPETSRESFRRHAKLWCDHVRKYGAEPVFYAAWAYDRLPAFDDDAICAEHARAAEENNARLANVGAARTAGPEGLDLFDDDKEHPSLAGTYLAACVIAATIYGAEALQAPKVYRPKNLSAGAASMLRAVALSTCE